MGVLDTLLTSPGFAAGAGLLAAGQSGMNTGQGLLQGLAAGQNAMVFGQQSLLRRNLQKQRLNELVEAQRQRRLRAEGLARVRELLPEMADDPLVKLLAGTPGFENVVAQAALKNAFAQPKQTSAVQNALALGLQPGSPQFNAFVREAVLKPGVVINQGGKSLNLSDLQKLRNEKGETPLPGTTLDQALAGGFKVTTPAEETRKASGAGALAFVDQLESLAFDPQSPLFKEFEGVVGRGKLGAANVQALTAQSDPNLVLFNDLSQSGLSIIVRSLGEKGTLNEGDIQRIRNALPKVSPLPDKPEIARQKLNTLRQVIQDVSGRKPTDSKRAVTNTVTRGGKTFVQFADGTWEQL